MSLITTITTGNRPEEELHRDLAALEAMLDSAGWAYLRRRLTEERLAIRAAIADDDTADLAQINALRAKAKILEDVITLPANDRGRLQHFLGSRH